MFDKKKYMTNYWFNNKKELSIYNKKYVRSKRGKIAHKKYRQSEKGKIAINKHRKSKIGILSSRKASKRYKQSKNGYWLHRPMEYLKREKYIIMENCTICNTNKNIEFHHPNNKLPLHIYFLCHNCHLNQHTEKKPKRKKK